MRKSRHIIISMASLLVAAVLLYYGMNYQGVMMSIVGAALLLQSLSIMATPVSGNSELGEGEFYKRIVTSYASNMEKLLASATGSQAFYVPFEDKVMVIVASGGLNNKFKIDILLDAVGHELAKELEEKLNMSEEASFEDFLSKLGELLKEKGFIEEFEYVANEELLFFKVKNQATIRLHKHLSRIAPKTYSYLGCPLTSAIAILTVKFLGESFMANFNVEGDAAEVKLKPARLGFVQVVRNERRSLA